MNGMIDQVTKQLQCNTWNHYTEKRLVCKKILHCLLAQVSVWNFEPSNISVSWLKEIQHGLGGDHTAPYIQIPDSLIMDQMFSSSHFSTQIRSANIIRWHHRISFIYISSHTSVFCLTRHFSALLQLAAVRVRIEYWSVKDLPLA